ncbi:DUF5133 domain-containing protein [Streptomyces sp. NBC_01283]|uniref:DUF5133 domain-containing protein n=1 Tax=Streptomyces sp. NBC_01283 TaxID=2903812 RepID=UPI00352DCFD6|nr:DUF5133 domain-containing protein [Streptomyces sp. NBC_01283]
MRAERATDDVGRQLERYRAWQRRFLASPSDAAVRAGFQDAVAALCAVTSRRCGREAAEAAERGPLPASARPDSARRPAPPGSD